MLLEKLATPIRGIRFRRHGGHCAGIWLLLKPFINKGRTGILSTTVQPQKTEKLCPESTNILLSIL